MRYPIYFFLLMSGFFYLTGKPIDDKGFQTLGTVPQLAYARKTSSDPLANRKTVEVLAKITGTASVVALNKQSAQPKNVKISQGTKKLTSFGNRPKTGAASAKKTLDWTVFSNKSKRASKALPAKTRPSKVLTSNKIPKSARSKIKNRKIARKNLRKRRNANRRLTRKTRLLRKKRLKRQARIKRRNKTAFRIARKAKKKTKVKKYSSKPPRKKFGFKMAGGVMGIGF